VVTPWNVLLVAAAGSLTAGFSQIPIVSPRDHVVGDRDALRRHQRPHEDPGRLHVGLELDRCGAEPVGGESGVSPVRLLTPMMLCSITLPPMKAPGAWLCSVTPEMPLFSSRLPSTTLS